MTGRTAKGEATRHRIVQAATEVFVRQGYAHASMAEIVDATGLTKGAVYFHFPSKAALAVAVVEHHKDQWLVLAEQTVADHPDPLDQLLAVRDLLVRLCTGPEAHWDVVRLAAEVARVEGEAVQVAAHALIGRWVDLIAGVLRAAVAAGQVRADVDPTDTALVLVSAFDGLKQATDDPAARPDDFARQAHLLTDLLLAGLRT